MLKCNKILIRHFDNYQESSYFLKNLVSIRQIPRTRSFSLHVEIILIYPNE